MTSKPRFQYEAPPETIEQVYEALGESPADNPADLSPVERTSLLYALIGRYARKMSDSRRIFLPLPGDGAEFMKSRARCQLATRSNRGGKTVHVAAKVARIFSGMETFLGFPKTNGRIMAVGKDWEHVGSVMWRKLAWPGQFQVIRDAETRAWRAVRPDPDNPARLDPSDLARREEWRPAAPFLPPDEIEVSYFKANLDQPKKIRHKKTGWEINFHSSEGDPRNGIDCDLVWFDEEIQREQWVPESLMRLVDRDGRFIWSFTPQASTPQAYELHKKAESGDPTIREYCFYIYNNPYLPEEAKEEIKRALSPAEVAVRYYGEYAITSRRVYPNFNIHDVHGVDSLPGGLETPPPDWMKVFFVDPGFQTCATLFGAIPPKKSGLFPSLWLYDESYLRGSNCEKYGYDIAEKTRDCLWEVAGIDYRFGRQSQATSGRPLAEHYTDEHRARGIKTRRSGAGFIWGSDNPESRTDNLHYLLDKKLLKVVRPKCQNFIREMEAEYYKKDQPDVRDTRKYGHLVACAEMMAAYFDSMGGLYYDDPLPLPKQEISSPALRAYRKKIKTGRRLTA